MRQPIKFLPYLNSTPRGGEEISHFKGLRINCKNIGESWELSGVPGRESIAMDGDDCGMTLTDLVRKYKDRLVGDKVYARYGDSFPLLVKFIDADAKLSIHMSHFTGEQTDDAVAYRYFPAVNSLPAPHVAQTENLMKCDYFHVAKEVIDGERHLSNPHDSFMGVVCIQGAGSLMVDGVPTALKQGESLLLPAPTNEFDVEGTMALLTIVMPTLMANAREYEEKLVKNDN